jgi:hypothetical protein
MDRSLCLTACGAFGEGCDERDVVEARALPQERMGAIGLTSEAYIDIVVFALSVVLAAGWGDA